MFGATPVLRQLQFDRYRLVKIAVLDSVIRTLGKRFQLWANIEKRLDAEKGGLEEAPSLTRFLW